MNCKMQPTYICFSGIIGILRRRRKKSPIQPENEEQSTVYKSFPTVISSPKTCQTRNKKRNGIHGPWLKTLKFKGKLRKTNTPVNMNTGVSNGSFLEMSWFDGADFHLMNLMGTKRFVNCRNVAKWDGQKTEAYGKKVGVCVIIYIYVLYICIIYMYYIYMYYICIIYIYIWLRVHNRRVHCRLTQTRECYRFSLIDCL